MTDVPSPFAPFQLPTATPAVETKPEKAPRKPRTVGKHPALAAPYAAVAEAVQPKPERKKREKKTIKAYAPKFELQTILAAASTLNENDFPLFEKLALALDEAGKPQRDRVLEAIGKVFG